MEFKNNEAIYLQIAAYVSDKILNTVWVPGGRIPAVRELSVELQVNPNTVTNAYEFLLAQGTIINKRGVGYFVEADADKKIKAYRRERFMKQDLPEFFKNISLLEITFEELQKRYHMYKTEH